jgi:hypothetical protein
MAIKVENVAETVNDLFKIHENAVVVPEGPHVVRMLK